MEITRIIDGKFVVADGQIVKESNGEVLPIEEPLFLMRARDCYALETLRFYLKAHVFEGDEWSKEKVQDVIDAFAHFQKVYPERMKYPGITRGK